MSISLPVLAPNSTCRHQKKQNEEPLVLKKIFNSIVLNKKTQKVRYLIILDHSEKRDFLHSVPMPMQQQKTLVRPHAVDKRPGTDHGNLNSGN